MFFNIFKRKKDESQRLKKEILAFGFNDPNELIKLIRPAVLIDGTTKSCPPGGSKFGGQPDLPEELEWPTFNDEAMVFIGQVNLSEISSLQSGMDLPVAGLLSFFIHFKEPENEFGAEYDFEPGKEEFKVMYFDNSENLIKKEFPSNLFEGYQFAEKRMAFSQHFQVPTTEESSYIVHSGLDQNDRDKLFDFERRYADGFMDQIGGYPIPIQQGVDLDWAAATVEKVEDRYRKSLELGQNYVNLFSFTLQYSFEIIGDSNCYFGITNEHLKDRKFKETILILQDT